MILNLKTFTAKNLDATVAASIAGASDHSSRARFSRNGRECKVASITSLEKSRKRLDQRWEYFAPCFSIPGFHDYA